jgi:spore coat protein U-like protein
MQDAMTRWGYGRDCGRDALGACVWFTVFALTMTSANAAALMNCTILNASGVSFGAYNSLDRAAVDSTGSVSFRCTGVQATDSIQVQLGRGSASSTIPRSMQYRTSRLEYNLYMDAQRSLVWGDGTGGTVFYARRPPEGVAVSVPVYGRIPARQMVIAGPYSDLVVVTVLF